MGPFIRTVNPARLVRALTLDALLDMLQAMSTQRAANFSASTVRAAFTEAARRGALTPAETEAGVALCLKLRSNP